MQLEARDPASVVGHGEGDWALSLHLSGTNHAYRVSAQDSVLISGPNPNSVQDTLFWRPARVEKCDNKLQLCPC